LKPSKLKLTFKLEPVIQSLAIVNLKSEFSWNEKICTVFRHSQKDSQIGIRSVKGNIVQEIEWFVYVSVKGTSVTFWWKIDPTHFIIHETGSMSIGQCLTAKDWVLRYWELRVTSSQIGMKEKSKKWKNKHRTW
jgi:hypothetical protein